MPILGRDCSARLDTHPVSTRRILGVRLAIPLVLIVATLVQFRYGILQRDRDGRGGLLEAQTDPTADLYGWDQVARRMNQLGLLDDPDTFVFTHYWYQSAHLAHALGLGHAVLCYNFDDPRGFAFWSRPGDWVGRDGILVVIGEHEAMARYYRRWFSHVELVADFWVERCAKPVRRIALYRCAAQRLAYPFAFDRAVQIARSPVGDGIEIERRSR
jgi:hypothetical protein